MIPKKLEEGDEVRIVSPAKSLALIKKQPRIIAEQRFREMGLKLTFSRNAMENDLIGSSSVKSRVADIHEAFMDRNVKAVIATAGGFNSNQLLKHIDYSIIRKNPKIFCGYSDITALSNSFYKKTGMISHIGPTFSSFGMKKGFMYTLEQFKRCMFNDKPFEIAASEKWSDDRWKDNQEKRRFIKNKGPYAIHMGEAEGTIIGGNLCTFNLLQGTEFMPSLKGSILFIEDDHESKAVNFDRDLQSLMQQPGFSEVRGIIIGRFQKESGMTREKLKFIISTKEELKHLPVIADADFGHTTPMFTFPIGGRCRMSAKRNKARIKILKH